MPSAKQNIVVLVPAEGHGGSEKPATPSSAQAQISYTRDQTLAAAIYLSGLFAPPVLCSGIALCKRCRVRVMNGTLPVTPADIQAFTPEELAGGWRLACRHRPLPGLQVALPEATATPGDAARRERERASADFRHTQALAADMPSAATFAGALAPRAEQVLALDLGTTSLQWRLLSVPHDGADETRTLWEGGMINPQMGAGSDVVSRLSAASSPAGLRSLRALTLRALRDITDNANALIAEIHAAARPVSALCLAANTAMSAVTLGSDVSSLASAPYALPYAGGSWEHLPDLPQVWLPPQLSPFVGGDISAGYAALALGQSRAPYPFLLADMGTNGEFLLALSPAKALTASVALGPALEGTGLSHGTEARAGAIVDFSLSPAGLSARMLPWPDTPGQPRWPTPDAASGITGTGYIALVHALLQAGVLQRDGQFSQNNGTPFGRFFNVRTDPTRNEERCLDLPHGMRLYASDVEELLKVKAAFSLGLQMLLQQAGVAARDLARVYVAGALGTHVSKAGLENLGFFAPGMASKLHAAGNTSLDGASLLAQSAQARDQLMEWAQGVRPLDLANDPAFARDYTRHMRFTWE